MLEKTKELEIFTNNFKTLKEKEQNVFSRIVNKLLQVNYLTIQKPEDVNDYRFIIFYKELFSSFLNLIDFELEIKKYDEVIFIKNLHNFNKLKLKKEESLILIILRILFQKQKETASQNNIIQIYLQDIYNKLHNIEYKEMKNLTKEKMKNILTLLKRYNIINYTDNNILQDDLIIKIYPSILYLIDLDAIEEYKTTLNFVKNEL
ncbi:hypothetical protein LFWB_5670 [Candidatus Phytoplasma luffae]|uniref:DUF4194 domain-containing protein n=1 Tax=Loofah witches'-broom phytoplasma TaxID=35773 RepID=A0A975FKJ5_LOWBP|nr:DUF4194 domain-containing protein [Candidatus Phytoplasma luffae]QTX03133.1 hypothetical protein LFWB_5670 [Candidatus Phytoplasma luffae]